MNDLSSIERLLLLVSEHGVQASVRLERLRNGLFAGSCGEISCCFDCDEFLYSAENDISKPHGHTVAEVVEILRKKWSDCTLELESKTEKLRALRESL